MNKELIKRINEYLRTTAGALAARDILRDCRAALSRTQRPVAVVSDAFSSDTHYIEVCEPGTRLELGTKLYLEPPLSQRVRYVPMTEAEIWELFLRHDGDRVASLAAIQSEVIRRAGLEVAK